MSSTITVDEEVIIVAHICEFLGPMLSVPYVVVGVPLELKY